MSEVTQAERLRDLQTDMQEMYESAKINENAALMERLSKSIASMAKQIKDQELHEREVIKRGEAIRYGSRIGTDFARLAKDQLGDQAIPILADLANEIDLIAEASLA